MEFVPYHPSGAYSLENLCNPALGHTQLGFGGRVGKISKSDCELNQHTCISVFFENLSRKLKIYITDTLHEDQYTFLIISLISS
jgi:hypothetical protein